MLPNGIIKLKTDYYGDIKSNIGKPLYFVSFMIEKGHKGGSLPVHPGLSISLDLEKPLGNCSYLFLVKISPQ